MLLVLGQLYLCALVAFVSVGPKISKVCGIEVADFQSDWVAMEAYDPADSFRKVEHRLGEVPLKVKVIVTPTRGPYEGWMFEAGSSQQADDDLHWLYCGILYIYDVDYVYLFAPAQSNANTTMGKAFCIDPLSWTSYSRQPADNQKEDQVMVKIFAWKSSSFPIPDVDTDWLSIVAGEPPYFTEVPHNITTELSLVQLQIRCYYSPIFIYAEGVGAGTVPILANNYSEMSGLVFAYNDSHTRIWSPNRNYQRLISVEDGYPYYRSSCKVGEFRVRGWKSLGQEPQQFSFTLNGLGYDDIPDMSALTVDKKVWDPLTNYISIQVKALDGPNEGFVFPAIGQVHRNAYPGTSYGGVVFGYSATNIRIFVPADESGTIVHVPENWGIEEYNQISNNVKITVKMWNTISDNCSASRLTTWRYTARGNIRCSRWTRCAITCLSISKCIGIIPCQHGDQCLFMNLDTVNNRTIDGILGANGEVLLDTFDCK